MKKTFIVLSIIPVLSFAMTDAQKEAFNKANIEALQKQGLPVPGEGIQIVSQESMKIKNWQKNQMRSDSEELKRNGYVNRSSLRAYEIMNIEDIILKRTNKSSHAHKPSDSHLRQNAHDIPFVYTYVGVPKEDVLEFYGIAPSGTYIQDIPSGWTGAVEFFKTSFGHCAYTENNMLASRGSVRIDENEASYDVNEKITLIDIEGNDSTGYLYRVNWFDNIFNRNLECATTVFSENIRNNTIELAKKIDKA